MIKPIVALLTASLVLSGCASLRDSRANPRNWFSRSAETPVLGPIAGETESRPLVPRLASTVIEPTSSGVILRAEAALPAVGWYDAELVPLNHGRPVDGVLTYQFVANPPRQPLATNNARARSLVAAAVITPATLEMTREIVVVSQENAQAIRR